MQSYYKSPIFVLVFFWLGGYLGFYFLGVLGVAIFLMALSLCPLVDLKYPLPSLFILGGLSRHVKSAHPPTNFVLQTNQAILSFQLSSLHVLLPRSISLLGVSFGFSLTPFWGCLSLISCALKQHRILQAI
jgi:hypothetical protein